MQHKSKKTKINSDTGSIGTNNFLVSTIDCNFEFHVGLPNGLFALMAFINSCLIKSNIIHQSHASQIYTCFLEEGFSNS